MDKPEKNSVSFNSILVQALTLGAKKVTPSLWPGFAGAIAYLGLIGLIWAGFLLDLGQGLIMAGIALLLLSGIISLLMLIGHTIYPVVLNILFLLTVVGFLGIGGYVIISIVTPSAEMELHANLLDADLVAVEKFEVSLAGHKGVRTVKDGYFELRRILPVDVHDGQIQLHIESPDGKYGNVKKTPLNPGTLTTSEIVLENLHRSNEQVQPSGGDIPKPGRLPKAAWRFIVSGDSRNCGDVVMPAIAENSAQFAPRFYWHLGDIRAIYKIDEDIAFATANEGQPLSCSLYLQRAWPDFIDHQIAPFGNLPFYLGIGNHEVIAPKDEDAFKRQFRDWLDQPILQRQRLKDEEPTQPEPYYHWIQGGVDFIYLDNAMNVFSAEQQLWLQHRLSAARADPEVKSVVVGMHEALPDSIANGHSMGDNPAARPSGKKSTKR